MLAFLDILHSNSLRASSRPSSHNKTGLPGMRSLSSVSWRTCLLGMVLMLFLYLHLKPTVTSPTSDLLQQIAKTQIQHGSKLSLKVGDHFDEGSIPDSQATTVANEYLAFLPKYITHPNPFTRHFRLNYPHLSISFVPPGSPPQPDLRLFNPTLLPLPSWTSSATYLLVSRVVTEGLHQESLICPADLCVPENTTTRHGGVRLCTKEDTTILGATGGLRCKTAPIRLNIPPTPALQCEGPWLSFPDIPGFHDPRIFWSGKGEPLIILNSASQYGCVGLWVADLRTLFPELEKLVNRHGKHTSPVISYPHLTEITRNPRSNRASVEKNWMFWFPGDDGEAYIQYDLGPASISQHQQTHRSLNRTTLNITSFSKRVSGRTFAKLIGNGFTTENLTSPYEPICFSEADNYDSLGKLGRWHQGSNSLKLVLCTRLQARAGDCGKPSEWTSTGRDVHFAIMHRKFSNQMDLPMRYERYVAVWEGRSPFRMLGVSRFPLLFKDEWARPWSAEENSADQGMISKNWTYAYIHNQTHSKRMEPIERFLASSDAYFTYTPSLAWAWRSRTEYTTAHEDEREQTADEKDIHHLSQLGTGFLGDEVIVGIGLDDVGQAAVRVKVDDLLRCLRLCPGVNT